ncbi:phytanoyl-CoA dioxygenase family protein [Denitrobaculum tricleocarpae]|nr:phytanoyl-CoA dioxygenase family protein [Denitrobaculum tricleocarpae]
MATEIPQAAAYFDADDCDLAEFVAITSASLNAKQVPHASAIKASIPLYDLSALGPALNSPDARRALMAEWAQVLGDGSGVLVLKNAYADTACIDAATQIFNRIIAAEKQAKGGGADHFATAGNNDRIWNALQKLCEQAPDVFALYFSSPAVDAVCEAWLGPGYQMTAQVNLVRPGAAAQEAHRDYHLGFQTNEVSRLYPAHVHLLSPTLTLQGGIAHCDMPVESGPTKLLPFSQRYAAGYTAWRRPDFRAHFEAHCVQLPLSKGDAFFFNPALFHAAGANSSSDVQRMANLLQISSAFGRAMETIDRQGMCERLYPVLLSLLETGRLSPARLQAVIAASAEGYSFPTNLDLDPPLDGLAPETQQALFHRALAAHWTEDAFREALVRQAKRQQSR